MVKFEKVKRIEEDIKLPERSTLNSAGYDFFALDDIRFPAETITRVFTGVKCELMPNQVLILANRSSNPSKKGLILLDNLYFSSFTIFLNKFLPPKNFMYCIICRLKYFDFFNFS